VGVAARPVISVRKVKHVYVPELLRIFLFDDLMAKLVCRRDDGAAALAGMEKGFSIDFLSDCIMDDVPGDDTVVVRLNPCIDPERLDADDFLLLVAHRTGNVHHVKDES